MFAYAEALPSAYRPIPLASAAPVIRSGLSPANSAASAASAVSPTIASAGSRTPSRNSANCFSGPMISTGISVFSKPGASVGTIDSAGRSVPVRASSARPTTSTASASSTPEM